jgi:hypothetical protein
VLCGTIPAAQAASDPTKPEPHRQIRHQTPALSEPASSKVHAGDRIFRKTFGQNTSGRRAAYHHEITIDHLLTHSDRRDRNRLHFPSIKLVPVLV